MARAPRQLPATQQPEHPLPPADELLRALGSVLAPLLRLLLASGLDYTRLAAQLKPLFIEQARLELLRTRKIDTDSAISLLSGVHRKDVRELRTRTLEACGVGVGDVVGDDVEIGLGSVDAAERRVECHVRFLVMSE